MISVIEHQPAGAGPGFPSRRDFFADGICCRARRILSSARSSRKWPWPWRGRCKTANTSRSRPARASANRLAYLIPAILFAVAQKKKAVVSTHTINLQEQLTEKDLPMLAGVLARCRAGEVQFRHAQGPRELSLHAPAAKGDAAIAATCSRRPRPRNCSASTSGRRKPRTAACRISTSSRTRKSGRRSVPSAGCARQKSAASRPILPRTTASAFFSARGTRFFRRTCWC